MEEILVKVMPVIFGLIAGLLLGWVARPIFMNLVGELRIDNSDPEQESMFLEIHKGKYQILKTSTYVLLKVNRKNYLSRK